MAFAHTGLETIPAAAALRKLRRGSGRGCRGGGHSRGLWLALSGYITSFRGFSFFHSRQESVAFATRLLSAMRDQLRRATHARQLTKLDCPDCRHLSALP